MSIKIKMKFTEICVAIVFTLVTLLTAGVEASAGDKSPYFNKCWEKCRSFNCTTDGDTFKREIDKVEVIINKVLLWECSDQCQYECMWKTVDAFKGRNWEIPQFFGKWPFIRVFGIQELGSVVGSFLNLLAHVVNYIALQRQVTSSNPLYWLWRLFFVICVNTWIWSIIFHTRDVWFTEFMDYACGFSMVVITFYCFGMRVLQGKSRRWGVVFTCFCVSYFANHVFYLYSGRIDYEYNMKANIVAGVLGGAGWVVWSCVQLWRGRRYVWRCLAYVLLVGASMYLELGDFPPKFQLWDAHAIWHLSTAPLPFLFYNVNIRIKSYRKNKTETLNDLKIRQKQGMSVEISN